MEAESHPGDMHPISSKTSRSGWSRMWSSARDSPGPARPVSVRHHPCGGLAVSSRIRSTLKTKVWLLLVAASSLPLLAVACGALPFLAGLLREGAVQLLRLKAEAGAREIGILLENAREDVLLLTRLDQVGRLLGTASRQKMPRALRVELEEALAAFARSRPIYDQLRLLDTSGMEVVRVHRTRSRVVIVPPVDLQDKAGRYYVNACLSMPIGTVYVSPLDLTEARGRVEIPEKPVVRFCSPVLGDDGVVAGLAIINLDGHRLFEALEPSGLPSAVMQLRDGSGQAMASTDVSGQVVVRPGTARSRPAPRVRPDPSGSESFPPGSFWPWRSEDVVFNVPIRFQSGSRNIEWSVRVQVPARAVLAPVKTVLLRGGLTLAVLLLLIVGLGSWAARRVVGPLHSVSEAARRVAGGNYDVEVIARTGDEIEALANDFQHMARELQQKEALLIAHQHELEEAVLERTRDLADEKEILSAVLDGSADAVVGVDSRGRIASWSMGARVLFGWTVTEAIGRPARELFLGGEDEGSEASLLAQEVVRKGIVRDREVETISCGGRVSRVEVTWMLLEEKGHGKLASAIILRDISARHELETRQRQLEARLVQAEKLALLGQVAAEMAHEIGHPLAAMKATVQDMEEDLLDEGHDDPRPALIVDRIDRIDRIVHGLLGGVRARGANAVACDAVRLIDEIAGLLSRKAREHGSALDVRMPLGLPRVRVDPGHMQLVLLNLILNALQAGSGKGPVTVTAREEILHGKIVFQVEDKGPCISPEDQEAIFSPFFSRKQGGTGLGLTVAANLIRENEGRLLVESSPGQGTVFSFALPVASEADALEGGEERGS